MLSKQPLKGPKCFLIGQGILDGGLFGLDGGCRHCWRLASVHACVEDAHKDHGRRMSRTSTEATSIAVLSVSHRPAACEVSSIIAAFLAAKPSATRVANEFRADSLTQAEVLIVRGCIAGSCHSQSSDFMLTAQDFSDAEAALYALPSGKWNCTLVAF